MEFDAKYNEVKFSSGKTKYAFNGVIGIDPSLKRVTEGWDGIVYEEGLDTELSKEDLIELADHMIERWRAFRAQVATADYYTISVDAGKLSDSMARLLAYQLNKDELCVSANLRLCGVGGAAYIDDINTAKTFLDICTGVLETRYGCTVALRLNNCQATQSVKLLKKIKADSAIVRARIEQQCFAPNKIPVVEK